MNKKKIICLLTTLFLMNSKSLSNNNGYSKKYQDGTVYIGNREYLESIDYGIGDVLVLDARDDIDPNMKVYSSYLINDPNIQREILNILMEYEDNNPSLWDRSVMSMQREWYVHNIMALFSCERERTMDVDFNNGDEEKYGGYEKKKVLK